MAQAVLGQRRRGAGRLAYAAAAVVGYILSPLSPWNDAFVNVPIALGFSLLLRGLGVDPFIGFQLGYTLSNAAGIALLYLGLRGAAGERPSRRDLAASMLLGLAYSLAAGLLFRLLGLL